MYNINGDFMAFDGLFLKHLINLEKDKIITQKNTTIASLNATIASRDTKIATLEQEVKRKDQELLQNRQKGDIAQLISKVKEPITALSEYFRIQDSSSHKPSPKFGAKNFKLGVINGGLSVCILLCVIVMNFVNFHTEDATATKETIKQLQIKIDTLTSDINTRDEKIAQLNARIEELSKPVPQPTPTTQPKQLRIDVNGYKSGKLSTENSYDISIKEGRNNYNGEGTWNIQNADIVKGNVNSTKITIKPEIIYKAHIVGVRTVVTFAIPLIPPITTNPIRIAAIRPKTQA